MKKELIPFWIATSLLSAMMLISASRYFFDHANAVVQWDKLGFPSYPIYFLACCKILGVLAILSNRNAKLKEWAYAGFFFNFCLAFLAQINAGDQFWLPMIAMGLLFTSYLSDTRRKS